MTAKAGRQFVGGSRRRMRLGKYYLGRYSTMLEIFSRQWIVNWRSNTLSDYEPLISRVFRQFWGLLARGLKVDEQDERCLAN